MEMTDYQYQAMETAIYKGKVPDPLGYTLLGLAGEAGETCNKYKKVLRDNNGVVDTEWRSKLIMELCGCLWYIAATATELKITLNEVARLSLAELQGRKERGTLQGEGDSR